MKKVDVIIPAYKAHKVILRALGSLAIQSALQNVRVTIVNDADPTGDYSEFVSMFKPYMDIQELIMEENGGPGVARQYGIDRTSCTYFTCMDADDSLSSPYAIQRLLKELEEDSTIIANIGTFAEDNGNMTFVQHPNDLIWMFGKMYRRSFIKKYNIRFNATRANEDNGFNSTIRLLASDTEKINFIPDIVYFWYYKEDSITRINNAEYSYNQSFPGYTINMIDSVVNSRKYKPFNPQIDIWAISNMAKLYNYYYQAVARDPRFLEQNYKACVLYYRTIYADLEKRFTPEQIVPIFSEVTVAQAPLMQNVLPDLTIFQFIEKLKNDSEKEAFSGDLRSELEGTVGDGIKKVLEKVQE